MIAFETPVRRPEDASQLADKLMYAVTSACRMRNGSATTNGSGIRRYAS